MKNRKVDSMNHFDDPLNPYRRGDNRTSINELPGTGEDPGFKVGDIYKHNLYGYRFEIIGINVSNSHDSDYKYRYANIHLRAFFSKDTNGEHIVIGDFTKSVQDLNEDNWKLVNGVR